MSPNSVKHFLQSIVQGLHSVQNEIAAGRHDSTQASRYHTSNNNTIECTVCVCTLLRMCRMYVYTIFLWSVLLDKYHRLKHSFSDNVDKLIFHCSCCILTVFIEFLCWVDQANLISKKPLSVLCKFYQCFVAKYVLPFATVFMRPSSMNILQHSFLENIKCRSVKLLNGFLLKNE